MKKYVACRIIDTVPLASANRKCSTAACQLAKVIRPSSRQQGKPRPGTTENAPYASVLQSLIGPTYTCHPSPAGELLDVAF